jgi:hypothetical protein
MRLTKAEKSVLFKAAQRPIAGLELSRKEQEGIGKLKELDLLMVFGAERYFDWWKGRRVDLHIFKTRIDKCASLLQTMNSESSAENPT